jgi:GT2 family glycosyltransferase
MKWIAERKPWNINFDLAYEPDVSVIVVTHNETETIVRKPDNTFEVDSPKDKIRVMIVDGSSDETPEARALLPVA